MDEGKVKEFLTQNDQEFRELVQQHRSYEQQLEELKNRPYLSTQQQVEETVIKKKKLAIKDQMQLRIQRYQSEHPLQ